MIEIITAKGVVVVPCGALVKDGEVVPPELPDLIPEADAEAETSD